MKLKKILAVISALCMMCAVIPIFPAQEIVVISANAEDAEYTEGTYENLNYKKYADHIEISGVKEAVTEANIPAEIDGLPVTTIGEWAFQLCRNLVSVTLPDSMITIREGAFYVCDSLITITIPDSVINIENKAFMCCSSLTSITIKNPDCVIYDSSSTISSGKPYPSVGYFNGIIYGYEGSTAQAYAEKYGLTFEPIGSAPETESQQGDADGNGKIDILDVITLNKAVMGKETLSEAQLKAIDFNGNGKPDSEEALTILKYIVGLITELA